MKFHHLSKAVLAKVWVLGVNIPSSIIFSAVKPVQFKDAVLGA